TLLAELRPALTGRESSDTFVRDDPAPGIEDLRRMIARIGRRLWRGGRTALWALPVIRGQRAQEARRAICDARQLLFVCKGNVCRRPFAERYARERLNHGVVVRSAGYYRRANRPCPTLGIEAARAQGVDLSGHRSTELTESMVREADAVFVFDYDALARLETA